MTEERSEFLSQIATATTTIAKRTKKNWFIVQSCSCPLKDPIELIRIRVPTIGIYKYTNIAMNDAIIPECVFANIQIR